MRIALLFFVVFASPAVRAQAESVELREKLETRVTQYDLSAEGLADALVRTATQFQLPMGIEWVRDKESLRGFRRTWKNTSVWEVLRSIVESYPGYTYGVENGVVHVSRRDLVNDQRNFLNLRVPDFFDVRLETGGLTNRRLRSVVQNIVSPRNLPQGAGEGGSYATGIREKPLRLTLRGATVRNALGMLAEASEQKIWVATFSETSDLTVTGFRRTETLWHPRPFPDNNQPMWDSLTWAEYPHKSYGKRKGQR